MAKSTLRKAPPRAARTRDRLPTAARRQQILAEAIKVFANTPYEAVNMDDFASRLGISKGLVFHYFPSKRALYVAGLAHETQALLAATKPAGSGLPAAAANLNLYLDYVQSRREAFLYLMRGGEAADPSIAAIMGDMRRQYMQRVCDHLQALGMRADLGDPRVRVATRGWVGLCEIATADWLRHGDPGKAQLLEYLLRMLAATVETIANHDAPPKRRPPPTA